ncbi:MAG: tetratricopeptide repeat protein [Candidatus Eisenbacteria bacterium]
MTLPPESADPAASALPPRPREVRLSAALPRRPTEPAPWQRVWRGAGLLAAIGLLLAYFTVPRASNPSKEFAQLAPLPVRVDPARTPNGEFDAAWTAGLSAYGKGDYRKAERSFRRALDIQAARAEVYLYLGSSLLLRHEVESAVEALSMAVSLAAAPEYWEESRWQLAQGFLLEGNPDAAVSLLREVVRDGRRHQVDANAQLEKLTPLRTRRN